MNRIIFDYYRRWAWVLGLAAVGEFGLGWLITSNPQIPFEFYAFMISLWSGATLLSFDFRRGALRPLAVLPVAGAQMGRGWWIATVPLPALVLAGLLFAGAWLRHHVGQPFPVERLVLSSLFTLVWLGVQFTMIFNPARGGAADRRNFVSGAALAWLSIVTFFGSMILCTNAANSVVRSALLLSFGTILTVAGWVLSRRFEPAHAGLYLGRVDASNFGLKGAGDSVEERKSLPLDVQIPTGPGGMAFLLGRVCLRTLFTLSAMVVLMVLCFRLQRSVLTTPRLDIASLAPSGAFMICWFTLFYRFIPALHQLRYLRTLPFSSARLAIVVLSMAVLPPLGVALLTGAAVLVLSGSPAAVLVLNSFLFPLAASAVCVGLFVWCGTGAFSQALLFVILFVAMLARLWLQSHLNHAELPVSIGGLTLGASVGLGFFLSWLALIWSSRAYRVHGTSLTLPWGR